MVSSRCWLIINMVIIWVLWIGGGVYDGEGGMLSVLAGVFPWWFWANVCIWCGILQWKDG